MPIRDYAKAKGRASGGYEAGYDVSGYRMTSSAKSGRFGFIDRGELNRSIDEVIALLKKKVGYYLGEAAVKDVFLENAKIFQAEMRKEAPMADRSYSRKKRMRKSRKKGGGSYHHASDIKLRGTLKRSITIFPGKGEISAYIGPRRKGAKFGDKKADGFYGYWQAYGASHFKKHPEGTDFIMKSYRNKRAYVTNKILKDLKKQVELANKDMNKFVSSVG